MKLEKILTVMAVASTLTFGSLNVSAQDSDRIVTKPKVEETKKEKSPKTSLLEATIYTGGPALGISWIYFATRMDKEDYRPKKILENYKWGLTHAPVWDKNPWAVNYIGHPEFNAEAYLLCRNRDHHPLACASYSVLASTTWEYGLEPIIGARPSQQDLFIAPLIGIAFGELRYQAKKALMKNEDNLLNSILIFALDPFDAIYKEFE